MDELIKKLKEVYFDSVDPRCNGLNPKCNKIWDEMEALLSKMDQKELTATLEALPEEDLEIIYPVTEDLAEEREYVEKFIH